MLAWGWQPTSPNQQILGTKPYKNQPCIMEQPTLDVQYGFVWNIWERLNPTANHPIVTIKMAMN